MMIPLCVTTLAYLCIRLKIKTVQVQYNITVFSVTTLVCLYYTAEKC